MDLDILYGPATIPPNEKIEPWEEKTSISPNSLQVLDEKNGGYLAEMLGMTPNKGLTNKYILNWTRFLWLILESGEIRIAVEEYIDADTGEPQGFRLPGFDAVTKIQKGGKTLTRLGHPALTDDLKARIGGELYWDDILNNWVISNGSGRYGFGREREEQHLVNVSKVFSKLGISAEVFYIE